MYAEGHLTRFRIFSISVHVSHVRYYHVTHLQYDIAYAVWQSKRYRAYQAFQSLQHRVAEGYFEVFVEHAVGKVVGIDIVTDTDKTGESVQQHSVSRFDCCRTLFVHSQSHHIGAVVNLVLTKRRLVATVYRLVEVGAECFVDFARQQSNELANQSVEISIYSHALATIIVWQQIA